MSAMSASSEKGRIVFSASIWCGRCRHFTDGLHRQRPAADAKAQGFRLTRREGWICPACAHVDCCQECEMGRPCSTGEDLGERWSGGTVYAQ